MVAFSGWLGWLDILDSLAIFSKASFINFQYVYGRFCWLTWLTCYFRGSRHFCQGKFYHFSISVWSLFLVGVVDLRFSKLSLFFSPSLVFGICMCAFTSWLGWLDIIDSLAIFSKASFSTFQYVYGRFLWLTWLTCYFQDSRHFCQGLFPNMYGRFCSLTGWLDNVAISRRLIF